MYKNKFTALLSLWLLGGIVLMTSCSNKPTEKEKTLQEIAKQRSDLDTYEKELLEELKTLRNDSGAFESKLHTIEQDITNRWELSKKQSQLINSHESGYTYNQRGRYDDVIREINSLRRATDSRHKDFWLKCLVDKIIDFRKHELSMLKELAKRDVKIHFKQI